MKTIVLLLAAALWYGGVNAQVPHGFNYQGYLTSPDGTPIDATVPMRFNLYDVADGGLVLHSETQQIVVTNGVFNATIGATPPLLPFDVPYWLGVKVGADEEMTPRQPLSASPYAIRSASTETLAAAATVAGSQITGAISTATLPAASLTGTLPVAAGGTGATMLTNNGVVYGKGTSAVGVTAAGTAGQVLVGSPTGPTWSASPTLAGTLSVGGNLGVGTAPSARFHVNGTSWFQGDSTPLAAGAGKGIAIGTSGTTAGYIFGFDYGTFAPMNLVLNQPGGNVGIGTLTPTGKLEIAAQDALRMVGYQPYLTFYDSNAGYARARIQSGGGSLQFYPETAFGSAPALSIDSGTNNVSVTNDLGVYKSLNGYGGSQLWNGLIVNTGSVQIYEGSLSVWGSIFFNLAGLGGDQDLCRNSGNRGLVQCSSSLRYKRNVHNYDGGLDVVSRLRPIVFEWIQSGQSDLGFGAEDVAKVDPLLTTRNQYDQIEGVKYKQISAVLVNAVNEQQRMIEEQRIQIRSLKKLVCRDHRDAAVCRP